MGFDQKEANQLLAETGRHCCICSRLHSVQLHHIVPIEEGGTDDIENAIPLCPNCHNEVHTSYAPGRATRTYSADELRRHLKGMKDHVRNEHTWAEGSTSWEEDKNLLLFYAQCLDRPAFRVRFHEETSFAAFDQAMEDTLLAFNTGYWRTREGVLLERGKGKVHLVHQPWRNNMDRIVEIIEALRRRFRTVVGFEENWCHRRPGYPYMFGPRADAEAFLRSDRGMGKWMDEQRQEVIQIMNTTLGEIGHQPLRGIA